MYLPRHPSQSDLFFHEGLVPVFCYVAQEHRARENPFSVRPDKHTRSGQVFLEVRGSGRINDGDTTRLVFRQFHAVENSRADLTGTELNLLS